jgi:hypothetical protein
MAGFEFWGGRADGFRILDLLVGWTDDPDSRVRIFRTILLSNRQVLFLAAAAELGIVWMVWRSGPELIRLGLLAWISTGFLIYRLGLWWIGHQGSCDCSGVLRHAAGISPETANAIMKGVLFYLLAGSYFFGIRSFFTLKGTESGGGDQPPLDPKIGASSVTAHK